MRTPVLVYAESTPNPATLKFVANVMLLPDNSAEYLSPEEAKDAPLVEALFQFPYVQAVYVCNNFITITKKPSAHWSQIILEIRPFLKEWLEQGKDVIIRLPEKKHITIPSSYDVPAEIINRILSVLDAYVRPAVESDGGEISFLSFEDGVLRLQLRGSCSGCPSSQITLKDGIERLLRQMVPEVREVVAAEV